MGRNKIFKDGKEEIGVYLSPDELKAFDEIRWRERKGKAELARTAILDYIKAHAEGNDTYILDKWNEDPNFIPTPTLLSSKEDWINYLNTSDSEERLKILDKANEIISIVKTIFRNQSLTK